jgi:Fur family ferric uptake transcriptional regulator
MAVSRKTKTVKLILELFENTNNAISVVDLVSIFKEKMNKTTVYRILNRLEESGILHSFTDRD